MNAAGLEQGSLTDDRGGYLGVLQLAGRQVARPGVNRELLVVEGEGRVGLIGKRQVGFIEGADSTDVLPVVVKEEALEPVAAGQ